MSAAVAIYSTDYCGYCVRAKALFTKKGVPYDEIDVSDRGDLRQWLMAATRQRTVPQIFINGRSVGGFIDIAELDRKGTLDRLLSEEPRAEDPPIRR